MDPFDDADPEFSSDTTMDAMAMLREDHHEVIALFEQFELAVSSAQDDIVFSPGTSATGCDDARARARARASSAGGPAHRSSTASSSPPLRSITSTPTLLR
jgi:hypothetical protein